MHSKWTTIVGIDPLTGEVVRLERVGNEIEELGEALGRLEGPLYGVMEAGTNSWAMYQRLQPLFKELVVAEPAKLWNRRSDRGAKTDRREALRMAQMLYRGEVEGIYIPDERTQDLRVLVRSDGPAQNWEAPSPDGKLRRRAPIGNWRQTTSPAQHPTRPKRDLTPLL